MRTIILAAMAIATLASCGTDHVVEQANERCREMHQSAALDAVRGKIVVGPSYEVMTPSLTLLRDQTGPSEAERMALMAYADVSLKCHSAFDAALRPDVSTLEARVAINVALADLLDGRTTWAEFNRRRADALLKRSAEYERASAAARAVMPIIMPFPTPVVAAPITCHTAGAITTCF